MPRRGRMSREERAYIVENAEKQTPEQIAKSLDRTVEMVREFIKDNVGVAPDKAAPGEITLRKELRATAEWVELQRQFTDGELRYFEEKYTSWLTQLKDNYTQSEETQIFLLLKNEILINRNLADKKRATGDMARMQTMLDDIYNKYPDGTEMSDSDKQLAANINEQLSATRAALSARTTELMNLQKCHSDLMKQLKATRDQRLNRVEASKDSFIEIIKDLMSEERRLKEGEHMELMRMAAEKEKERLSGYHTYADGNVDRPFLNSDTVGLESPDAPVPPPASEAV